MTKKFSSCGSRPNRYYDDEIVISGISGRFPDSNNIYDFQENLMNKIDLVTDDDRCWKLDDPEIPRRRGKINDVEKFDSSFFGIHFKEAHTMDPMGRMLLEHAYEAIIDAGVNPCRLRGSKTGVFIGGCSSESELTLFYEKLQVDGLSIPGCSRAMQANRISHWLGINGPSHTVDSACSSSLIAMENAYFAIRTGQCDAALVGTANLNLHPYVSLQFSRLGTLAPDGRCKTFDAEANGFTRSESVTVVYLQKAKDAKRIYASFVHAKTNCDGYKDQGITFPSSLMQTTLLRELYEDCNISPMIVSYVEAHGTGTKVGDPAEVDAIEKIFCPGRTTPLKIGSVKSNMGHSEPASGLCGIAKLIIAMESGLIPPNLHYKTPREEIKALHNGNIKVVSEVTPWEGGYAGISAFGFGGSNVHLLLKSNPKEKINNGAPKDDLPRLVVASGRTNDAVDTILNDVEKRPVDVEYVRLIQDIHNEDIPGHMYRGYTIVGGSATQDKPIREIQHHQSAKRPIWFVFSGMGSQWSGMGTCLLRLPIFADTIKKCDAVLKPRGVDIYDILSNPNKSILDNILNSFVGIAAIQIGLVDLLTHVGIVPDKIIGHTVGEFGCAYADGCLTAEETVLAAYSQGLILSETRMIDGSMAVVDLGYQEVKEIYPVDIDIACYDRLKNSTYSGTPESIKVFDAKQQGNKIFATRPELLASLPIIPQPKPKNQKWVSTSVCCSEQHTSAAHRSSAAYHTNNLLNPALFEECLLHIPKNAVTIEIAPDGFLQEILRRSLHSKVTNVALMKQGHKDNVEFLLQSLGKLFNVGFHPQISKLYPNVEFPVSRGTPMLSPLVKWEHSDDWYVMKFKIDNEIQSGERNVEIKLASHEYKFMAGHDVDGRNLLPATGYLTLVWETFGMMRCEIFTNLSVVFEDVKFLSAVTIPKEGCVELTITIQKNTGRFEIMGSDTAVVTGIIRTHSEVSLEMTDRSIFDNDDVIEEMNSDDIYKDFRLRGYSYSGMFKSLKSATVDATKGTIIWMNNWTTFIDGMMQMKIFNIDSRQVSVPTRIRKLTIDTKYHKNLCGSGNDEKDLTVWIDNDNDAIIAGGVEILDLKANVISRRKTANEPVLQTHQFVAHCDNAQTTLKDFTTISTHIAEENNLSKLNTVEVINENDSSSDHLVSQYLIEILGDMPLIETAMNIVARKNPFENTTLPPNIKIGYSEELHENIAANFVIGHDLFTSSSTELFHQLLSALEDRGFLLSLESEKPAQINEIAKKNSLDIVLEKCMENKTALLLRKRHKLSELATIIKVTNNSFQWLPQIKSAMESVAERFESRRIILVSEKDCDSGILGLVQCLKKEPGGEMIRGYFIQDPKAPDFSEDISIYADQLELDLALNVLRANCTWGSYRHLNLPEIVQKPIVHGWANQLIRGDLSTLCWLEGPLDPSRNQKNIVRVVYASINFRDIMFASGKLAIEVSHDDRYHQECPYGLEYCGFDKSGRRTMGLVKSRGFTNITIMDESLAWSVPDSWSLEDAATVPSVYATSYYAFYMRGEMKKGDKILIHVGSGGLGQAAIILALHDGCEVFTTAGTPEKRKFIREQFPQIAEDHIGNSRDTSFEQMVIKHTKGRGVDIVLNSLAEDKLQASVRCLAIGGRFLEVGKIDLAANNPLGMEAFLKGISFHGILLDRLFEAPAEKKQELRRLLQRGLDSGAVKPVTRTVFPKEDIEAAFRYMAAAKHIGKVLIQIYPNNESIDGPITALPRFHCLEDRSYIILGGLGGFGLELADWLVLRGARKLVITSRTGVKTGYQTKRIALWKSYGTTVVVIAGKDASKHEDAEDILKTAVELGPVDAIFNLAVILKDALIQNQTEANFNESFRSKAWATRQLDQLSRKICPMLQHFVVFSSLSCGRGNAGQANYGMSNSIMERICERRVSEGLPGLAIQWGEVGDVGLLADVQGEQKELVIGGTTTQNIISCLAQLDKFLKQKAPIVSSMVLAENRAGGTDALNVIDRVLNIMGLKDLKSVNTRASFTEIGMDSMMAVELKQTLEREFEIFLNSRDLHGLTFAKLLDMKEKGDAKNKRGEIRSGNRNVEIATAINGESRKNATAH